jgi:hypothetical protein
MVRIINRLEDIRHELKSIHGEGEYKYTGSGKYVWIIAAEDVKFESGDIKPIKIESITIPPDYVGFLDFYGRNRYGHVIAVGEKVPLTIEMERHADYATFAAAIDGEVKKGDLIGTLILSKLKIY